VIVRTDNWGALEGFQCYAENSPERTEDALRELLRKWHIRMVLQDGERMYLILLQGEALRRSNITTRAEAKLGKRNEEGNCMHLVSMDGTEVSISVGTVDSLYWWLPKEVRLTDEGMPDMLLSEEDAQHLGGTLLTGWKTDEDHLKGWASQGIGRDRVAPRI
jgi:hypothetical protein